MPEFREDKAPAPTHTDEYKRTVLKCGDRREHLVRVHRSNWPPRWRQANTSEPPSLAGRCERCEATLIVYDPPHRDITVVLYGDPGERVGVVKDEEAVGVVVSAEQAAAQDVSQVGSVVEEPRRGRK